MARQHFARRPEITAEGKARVLAAALHLRANGVEPIDGAYVIPTKQDSVDNSFLFPARTKAQRNVRRMFARIGRFCAFLPVSALPQS